ncbi:MAG: hypothetical protein IJV25_00640 [Prevotella sp.]|nr:hypothetical protein [Prevotella sp.]
MGATVKIKERTRPLVLPIAQIHNIQRKGTDSNLGVLYSQPFPSTRTGAIFNAFSYPTKISAEAEALFIACHTNIGDTILDPFGGSGTTGIATKLADSPTDSMKEIAAKMGLKPQWGPRKAVVYEISTIGCLLGKVMCNTPSHLFEFYATALLDTVKKAYGKLYQATDPKGNNGHVRYAIWSDVVRCPHCHETFRYSDVAVEDNPMRMHKEADCPLCGGRINTSDVERVTELVHDNKLGVDVMQKKRVLYKIYGETEGQNWSRFATDEDNQAYLDLVRELDLSDVPDYKIHWGELYRHGYHFGITHLQHFYTQRNVFVLSKLWKQIESYPAEIQDALKVFLLSYNSSHSTLMTRVVVKKDSKDFVITGAQPGVLYISSLPVEKNIFLGLRRKIKTFVEAFQKTESSNSVVEFRNESSTHIALEPKSVDYIFTDPPFGDFIPYSEINQINEAWLGIITDSTDETIINGSQGKSLLRYRDLMQQVFSGMSRVLSDDGKCTLVFHSAKAEIWRAIVDSYKQVGFESENVSMLDKKQFTFKQTNSNVTVKGDPLILLTKTHQECGPCRYVDDKTIANELINSSGGSTDKDDAVSNFSKYIMRCIENNVEITLDAKYFFR